MSGFFWSKPAPPNSVKAFEKYFNINEKELDLSNSKHYLGGFTKSSKEMFLENIDKLKFINLENLEKLNLSKNSFYFDNDFYYNNERNFLEEIISIFTESKNLKELDISENSNIQQLPGSIGNFTNLTKLNLSETEFYGIPDTFSQLTNLTHLNLTGNLHESWTHRQGYERHKKTMNNLQNIEGLINLKVLYLRNFQIINLPNLSNLTSLTNLYLSNNGIRIANNYDNDALNFTNMESLLQNLTNLKELNLSYNEIQLIPDTITQLTNLENLDFSNNPHLKVLPINFGNLNKLKNLNLSFCSIEKIPNTFSELTELELLNLSKNKIEENELKNICSLIKKFPNLKELYLNGNKLVNLDPEIFNIISQPIIYINWTQIERIPNNIKDFSKLRGVLSNLETLKTIPQGYIKWYDEKNIIRDYNLKIISKIDEYKSLNKISDGQHNDLIRICSFDETYWKVHTNFDDKIKKGKIKNNESVNMQELQTIFKLRNDYNNNVVRREEEVPKIKTIFQNLIPQPNDISKDKTIIINSKVQPIPKPGEPKRIPYTDDEKISNLEKIGLISPAPNDNEYIFKTNANYKYIKPELINIVNSYITDYPSQKNGGKTKRKMYKKRNTRKKKYKKIYNK